ATAKYIKQHFTNPTCFMIGEIGLQQALKDEEIEITNENATHVVMGIDKQINYQKLASAADFVRKGATFISTNKDLSLPSEDGIKPGNGALIFVVELSSCVELLFIGKPAKSMIKIDLEMLDCSAEEVLLIGDNYFTDIKGGEDAGEDLAFVLTGISKKQEMTAVFKTIYLVNNFSDLKL